MKEGKEQPGELGLRLSTLLDVLLTNCINTTYSSSFQNNAHTQFQSNTPTRKYSLCKITKIHFLVARKCKSTVLSQLSTKTQSCSNACAYLSGMNIDLRLRKMCSHIWNILALKFTSTGNLLLSMFLQ